MANRVNTMDKCVKCGSPNLASDHALCARCDNDDDVCSYCAKPADQHLPDPHDPECGVVCPD